MVSVLGLHRRFLQQDMALAIVVHNMFLPQGMVSVLVLHRRFLQQVMALAMVFHNLFYNLFL